MTRYRGVGHWRWLIIGVALLSATFLASCGFPLAGGMLAGLGLLTLLAVGALSMATLGGCSDDATVKSDSKVGQDVGNKDTAIGPCLSPRPPDAGIKDTAIGPCLSPPPPDAKVKDTAIGPCLSPPPPDAKVKDTAIGPCLSPPPPDGTIGPCLNISPDGHLGPCLSPRPPDGYLGPCLSPRPPDGQVGALDPSADNESRSKVIARLESEGAIPAELAARLRKLDG